MRSGADNIDGHFFFVDAIDDAILVRQANRKVSLQVADEVFASLGFDGEAMANNVLEFRSELWCELVDVLHGAM